MADLETTLSELDPTSTIPIGSLLLTSLEDLQAASGYESYKITAGNVANQFMTAYSFNGLNTTSKNVVGAVNEVKGKEVTGTLLAGNTSITLQDAAITTTSTIDIYTDVFGISPESVAVATGEITITFEEQAADLGVKVVIK
jgi:hypothetical protein